MREAQTDAADAEKGIRFAGHGQARHELVAAGVEGADGHRLSVRQIGEVRPQTDQQRNAARPGEDGHAANAVLANGNEASGTASYTLPSRS